MHVFISHSSVNYDVAEEVCNLIEKSGKQCFLAPRDIRSGYEYAEEIMSGIEQADVMVLLLSKQANESPHVLREVERAVSKRIPLIVYKLEEVQLSKSMEYFLMSHQWVSAKTDVGHGEIVKCVNAFAERKAEYEALKKQQDMIKERELQPGVIQKSDTKRKQAKASAGNVVWIAGLAVMLCLVGVIVWLIFDSKEAVPDAGGVFGQEQVLNGTQTSGETQSFGDTQTPKEPAVQIAAGDTIVFGIYNEEPIEWRVLKLSEDGKTAVVVSKDILTMKAFDVAESGSYNYYNGKDYWGEDISEEEASLQRQIRGNSEWADSNIRTWLNSATENVVYTDQKPTQISMSEYKNGYDKESGFLSCFSEEELAAILVTDVETNGNVTQDKVYLLSMQELQWFEEADVSLTAIPTEAALEQDASNWYEVYVSGYGVKDYFWWLRDRAESHEAGAAYKAYMVSTSYTGSEVISEVVGLEGFGIRPAITIDLTAECIVVK